MSKPKPRALKDYIDSVLDDIDDALKTRKGYAVRGPIKFSLSVVNTKSGGGGLKVYVVGAEGKYQSEEISRIEFSIHPPKPE
ncbi:MAG TPA: trypco2 family protein [Candidatus Paceibacterota bacterium]|nr:trypco2 family protein [Candidatus Paceibacterota bacterium]